MNKIILCIIFATILVGVHCIDFEDCGATTGSVTAISVSGCAATATACDFKVGTNVSINVSFQSKIDSNKATVKVWGIILGIPIPFNLEPSQACGHWNINCPIAKGSANELKITMPILSQYPSIQLKVRVALLDSNGSEMLCQQFPAHIV